MNGMELVNYHAQIMSELPELLSQLALKGKEEEALKLLVEWGTHSKANSQIWKEAKNLLNK